jgi:hypothetical protein
MKTRWRAPIWLMGMAWVPFGMRGGIVIARANPAPGCVKTKLDSGFCRRKHGGRIRNHDIPWSLNSDWRAVP